MKMSSWKFGLVAALVLSASPVANATVQRTAVSRNGIDTNPCTPASPCRTVTAALAQTNTGGEVIVLDSGGYDPFSVTNPASVIAPPGVYAGITIPPEGTPVYIGPPNGGRSAVRGLTVIGLHNPNAFNGILVSGNNVTVQIESCVVTGLDDLTANGTTAIGFLGDGLVTITDSIVRDSKIGIGAVSGTSAIARVSVIGTRVESSSRVGIEADNHSKIVIRKSVVTGGAAYGILTNFSGTGVAEIMVDRSEITHNGDTGIVARGFSAINVSNSRIAENVTGIAKVGGLAAVNSFGGNTLRFNTTADGTFDSTSPKQ